MKLVCLGDSLTYGYEVRRPAVWTALAARECGITILNRGINGLLTAGMLGRFAPDVLAERPDAVLLMGGANDILSGFGREEPEKNITAMALKASGAGIRPLIGVPAPFCPPIREDWDAVADFPAMAPIYEAFSERLLALCVENAWTPVDFRAGLARHVHETGTATRSLYGDGIHLNEAGHRVFAATLARALRENGLIS